MADPVLTQIASDGAGQTIAVVNNFMAALDSFIALQKFLVDAGIPNFSITEIQDAIQALYPHLDGAKLNQFYNPIAGGILFDLIYFLENTTVSGGVYDTETYRAMMNKIRNG